MGIGLSLVRTLVELHGGAVTADSAGLGQGSCFTVRLPIAGGAALDTLAGSAGAAHTAPSKVLRILVVDDNEDAASSLAMLLQQVGHTVSIANDGLEAVREAARFVPEFVFLDIGLPGLNGYEVVKAIRQIDGLKIVPVVALTGWGAAHDVAHAAEAGFDSHLTKPASIEPIMALIQRFAG